jgi:hypothetical protein
MRISNIIDREQFQPLLFAEYRSDTKLGGYPHTNVVVFLKLLVLPQRYSLSD